MTKADTSFDIHDTTFVASYDDLSLWSALSGTLLLDHLPMGPYAQVLDVGCGTGFPLIELAGRFGPRCQVTGIDTWPEAIQRAQQKIQAWVLTNASADVGDAAAMGFEDSIFDLVVSNLGINNFTDPIAVTKECARVLKPRRPLIMTTNLRGHMETFYDAFRESLEALNETESIGLLDDHLSTRMTQDELVNLLEDAGFTLQTIELRTSVLRYRAPLKIPGILCPSVVESV